MIGSGKMLLVQGAMGNILQPQRWATPLLAREGVKTPPPTSALVESGREDEWGLVTLPGMRAYSKGVEDGRTGFAMATSFHPEHPRKVS